MSPITKVNISTIKVDGVDVFYRYAGAQDGSLPAVVLLHGFPTSSFQYRNLIPILAATGKYRVVAPDLPGFGFTNVPEERKYEYTFDGLKKTVIAFLDALKINKFAAYIFDYGAPTLFRIALEQPERVAGIVTQNGNAYVEGLGRNFWPPVEKYWAEPTEENRKALKFATEIGATEWQYKNGTPDPSVLAPETWHLDAALMARPGNADIQIDFFKSYATNVALYPKFHEYLRKHQPPTLAIWGKNDAIFVPEGAEAFKRDLKDVKVKFVDGGHFSLESHLEEISDEIIKFLEGMKF